MKTLQFYEEADQFLPSQPKRKQNEKRKQLGQEQHDFLPLQKQTTTKNSGGRIPSKNYALERLKAASKKNGASWGEQLDREMIKMVIEGKKWKEIAESQLFRLFNHNGTTIKRNFQSSMRMKFRVLYHKYFTKSAEPAISDCTFKIILRDEPLEQLYNQGILSSQEKNLLLNYQGYFAISLYKGQAKLKVRSHQVRNSLMERANNLGSPKKMIDALIKINSHYQNEKTEPFDIVKSILNGSSFNTNTNSMSMPINEQQNEEIYDQSNSGPNQFLPLFPFQRFDRDTSKMTGLNDIYEDEDINMGNFIMD